MAIYRCRSCGSMYDEKEEGVPARELKVCPACRVVSDKLVPTGGIPSVSGNESRLSGPVSASVTPVPAAPASVASAPASPEKREALPCDPKYARLGTDSRYMDEIHEMVVKGKPIIAAMGTQMSMSGWDDTLFLGAQLNPMPLDEHAPVKTETIIGKKVRKPMALEYPVYISHMPFGVLSKETKIALAVGSAMARTAMCSGEGGILPQERETAYKHISEYVLNLYSMPEEDLRRVDVVEIRIGQSIKPGMGGHLPGNKVIPEIAAARGKPLGRGVISPSRLSRVDSKEDLKVLMDRPRKESEGRPTGTKTMAGRIERDPESCAHAGPDFITIDGRGGATGASPKLVRDFVSVPTIHALHRARKYLDEVGAGMELVIIGGLRVSFDLAKALAMGADTVAIVSVALIAAACQQHRICRTGMCPVGVAIQGEVLCRRLPMDVAAWRMVNFLNVLLEEIKTFARITGHHSIHGMDMDDLCIISREIPEFTNIRHA